MPNETKDIQQFFTELSDDLEGLVIGAVKSVIDEEVKAYEDGVTGEIPVGKTGKLKEAFTVVKINRGNGYYGYSATFEGSTPDGTPYQKIANVLNYGRPANEQAGAISGTFFFTKRIKKLKGMDGRIEARISAEIAKRT